MPRRYLNKLIEKQTNNGEATVPLGPNSRNNGPTLDKPTPGRWLGDEGSRDFLSKLVDAIDVGGSVTDMRLAHSVPSVYARPIIFAQAFKDGKSTLHKAAVKEWRGLMAVLGLASWVGYKLDFRQYSIEGPAVGMESKVGDVPIDDRHLRTMLHRLLPEPPGFWNPLRLIYVKDVPVGTGTKDIMIGATSPWTLVFTPAGRISAQAVPWWGGGLIYDPLGLYEGTTPSLELTILHQWIGHLLLEKNRNNWGMEAIGGDFLDAIGTELVTWQKELAGHVDNRWKVPGLSAVDNELRNRLGPYQHALRGAQRPGIAVVGGDGATTVNAAEPQSDLFLSSTKSAARRVVVLSRSGLSDASRVYDGAFVRDIDIEHLPTSSGTSLRTKSGVSLPVEWVIAEEVFFPSKLARVSLAPDALTCGAGAATDYSIPLTTAFFSYFNHEDVTRLLQLDVTGAGADSVIGATLTLPLRGNGTLPIHKSFSASRDLASVGAATPAFGLWPNFAADDWTHNFASFAGPSQLGDELFTVQPIMRDGSASEPATRVDGSQKDLRIWKAVKPLIGFALAWNGEQAGLVLRKWLQPPEQPQQKVKWVIAVDFGTANTMIRRESEGGPQSQSDKEAAFELKPRLVLLNKGGPANQEKLKRGLYPDKGVIPPFRTLLYKTEATAHGLDRGAYSLRFEFLPADVSDLIGDLKWSKDPAPMRTYLDALVRYIVCEARYAGVSKLVLKWSYPLSLPSESKEEMSRFWSAVANTYDSPILSVEVGDAVSGKTEREESVSESEATCRAFGHYRNSPVPVNANGLCVAVDVGGGSTDFAYWSNRNLIDQFSFKLAGNDVLRGDWLKLPDFLEKLTWAATGETLPGELLEPLFRMNGTQVEVMINHVLSTAINDAKVPFTGRNPLRHPAVIRIFSGGHTTTPWLEIRTLALLLFGGISYYAGLHAREAIGKAQTKNRITLCFGGRGANLLAWLSNQPAQLVTALRSFFTGGVQFDNSSVAPDLKVDIVGASVGDAEAFPPLKEEVATGTLRDPIGSVVGRDDPCVGELGWSLPSTSAPVEWNKRLKVDQMATLLPPLNPGKSYIDDFRDRVANIPEVAMLNIDARGIGSLEINWNDIQDELVKDIRTTGVTQPLFAVELKSLIKQYVAYALRSVAAAASK